MLTNPQEIQLICGDAELPVQQLNMTGSPELLWEEALEKANRGGNDTLRLLLEEVSKKTLVFQADPTFMAFLEENHDQHTATGPIAELPQAGGDRMGVGSVESALPWWHLRGSRVCLMRE